MEFMEQMNLKLFNQFTKGCLRCYELRYHLKLVYLHISKFLSYYTVRYHRCYAPRYRLDVVSLLPLVTASYHTRPWQYLKQSFNARCLYQGFVEPDAMDVCVAALLYALLPQASHVVSIDEHTQIKLVQPWLETVLAGMKAVLVRAQKQRANPLG